MNKFFRYSSDLYFTDTVAYIDIACNTNTGTFCPGCRLAYPAIPPEFLICRSYDKYDPNLSPLADFYCFAGFRVVSDRVKSILEQIPSNHQLDFLPARLVENPERRKGFGKRKAAQFDEELAIDCATTYWRLRTRTVLPPTDDIAQPVCPKCERIIRNVPCGDNMVIERPIDFVGGVFHFQNFGQQHKNCDEFTGILFACEETCKILADAQITNVAWTEVGRFL